MKLFIVSLLLFGGLSVFGSEENRVLQCKIDSLDPVNAHFFVTGGRVEVNDEFRIDSGAKEIDRIEFKSGRHIPFYRHGAKFVSSSSGVDPSLVKFSGIHQGVLGTYRGIIQIYHAEKNSSFLLQVLLEDLEGGFALHTAEAICERAH